VEPPRPIELTDEQRATLTDAGNFPSKLIVNSKEYTPSAVLGSGFKGVVWLVFDEFGRRRAAKLSLAADYQDRSYLLELSQASKLDEHAEFAHFIDAGLVELNIPVPGDASFVGFIEEYVDGVTLQEFLNTQTSAVTVSFFLAYVKALANVLSALQIEGLRHDDLHLNNVMVANPGKADLFAEYRIKVIDTGSLKRIDQPTRKRLYDAPVDDHLWLVQHLVAIWNTLQAKKLHSIRDRRFLAKSLLLLRSMLDDDSTIALRDPRQIVQQFELAYSRASSPREETSKSLSTPFEYISAEHIADDRVLVDIFAKSCPWLSKVAGRDPCLLTGPRGCGKSTIFRWLSLKAHLNKVDASDVTSLRIGGFYLSCSADLQNRLSWIKASDTAERHHSHIIHYFNLLLSREVLQTLTSIRRREDSETFWGVGPSQEDIIYAFFLRLLRPQSNARLQGVSKLEQVVDLIETEMFATHADMLSDIVGRHTTPETMIGDLSALLSKDVEYFRSRTVCFLVDDYSVHRIPEPVQLILNRIIWERRPSHVFKLSSEKYGAVSTDQASATADPTRELLHVDIGTEYIALDDADLSARAVEFATELLDNRLAAAGYEGRTEILIGHSKWPENSLAKALCDRKQGRHQSQYHGIECISQLCSGDISTLLFVYSKIFDAGGVTPNSAIRVKEVVQHTAIREVSRQLLEHVRHYFPSGPEMFAVVNAFGNLVRSILDEGRWQKSGKTQIPTQCPRIEIDQRAGGVIDALPPGEQSVARELIRRAVFIEMSEGLSRHGNVTTLRWHLRRVYLPAFGAALAKNDAVKQKPDWMQFFLQHPREACDQVWRAWQRGEPRSLFDGEERATDEDSKM
jgi:serine/threonine protein kinase